MSDDGQSRLVEWSENGRVICLSREPSASVVAVEAPKESAKNLLIQVLVDVLDSGKSPTQAQMNRAFAFALLFILVGRDAALAADAA